MRFFIDSVQGETMTYAQAAELQVFGAAEGHRAGRAAEPDAPFTDSGTIAVGNPAMGDPTGLQHVSGVTANEFEQTCTAPPASQGVDAWVSSCRVGSVTACTP